MRAPRATRAQRAHRLVLALRRTRHTRQLCSCCGRRQLLPDLAAATGSFPFRRHTVGRGAGFLFPRGYLLVRRRVGHLSRHATVRACPCVLVCVSGEMEVPVLTGYVEHSEEHTA